MEDIIFNKLKRAANQFYGISDKDIPQIMSDEEYDELAKQYETESGKSIKSIVDWPDQLTLENDPEDPLEKDIVKDNDLQAVKTEMFTENALAHKNGGEVLQYANLKYDGGGIKLVYDTKGRLQRIQSTPDEEFGIVRTEQFWDIVPHQIPADLGIKCIRGEVLVDAGVYGKLARNKANGLINSTVNQEEINQEAFIRWYKITYFDGNWTLKRQADDAPEIPTISKVRLRRSDYDSEFCEEHMDVIFREAERLYDNVPTDAIWMEAKTGHQFQCDGIVIYTDMSGIRGKKFYFTDSAVTKVIDVMWNKQSNGSYAAVLKIDPVDIDEKHVKQVSSGGVSNMMGLSDNSPGKMGIGAIVRIILANTTIPKIVEVIRESDNYNWPTCECGYKMSEDDIYGSTLKCGNIGVCSSRVNMWKIELARWIVDEQYWGVVENLDQAMINCPIWFAYAFFIDRWDPFDQTKIGNGSIGDGTALIDIIKNFNEDDFESSRTEILNWCKGRFKFSELQFSNLEVNAVTGLKVLKDLYDLSTMEAISKFINDYNETGS